MRTFMQTIPGGVPLIIGLALICLIVSMVPIRPQMWLYPLVRQAVVLKINFQTRDMLARETPHFFIRYTERDADSVDMVATAAEAAYEPVTATLNYAPEKKTLILIYPDRQAMKGAYGWVGESNAMGFYWGGVIQILSPKAWMKNSQSVEEFITTGPLAHEYTHLVLDHLARGNYTRWFTEGLAQYVEYKVNGYEWLTAENGLSGGGYSFKELDHDFDGLPNQALAYRQSLAAVRYIAEVQGDAKLTQVLAFLKSGVPVNKAIERSLGMDYASYETMVNLWAQNNMKQYSKIAN
ncbi:peptidase MA family metallohydrolase [Sporomusa acidovorans]|uniref:Peptidase MA-like domain-containing protein n=1 Tax=Sporomusa acidovorans (strain ATCC 49682 / DSM 3132 / Mol) TaxID=1123286 RepID=A0ABZ3JA17_SPOA4|nr:hypothetical protein [Sporomusa acidovorans]OZC22940.1 hypothetical protein SPACI_10130 [Sporomusa acidovorans DSM 3132]SDE94630.1 hypothetical protein SAMN04488499_102740 [Sporomusa acidovorans]